MNRGAEPITAEPPSEPTAPALLKLTPDVFDQLFGDKAYTHRLRHGTIISSSDKRIVYLPSDLLRGIYNALEKETGDAWGEVLKSCGFVWGKRVARSLKKELWEVARLDLDRLPVSDFVTLLERYFAHHGWGVMRISLADAAAHGVIQARLSNSLFAEVLSELDEPVDYLVAGMLRSMFEMISGRTLDCLEVYRAGARDDNEEER